MPAFLQQASSTNVQVVPPAKQIGIGVSDLQNEFHKGAIIHFFGPLLFPKKRSCFPTRCYFPGTLLGPEHTSISCVDDETPSLEILATS